MSYYNVLLYTILKTTLYFLPRDKISTFHAKRDPLHPPQETTDFFF